MNLLVEDQQQREERGAGGQRWVRATHNRQRFHEAWMELARAWTHAPGAPVRS